MEPNFFRRHIFFFVVFALTGISIPFGIRDGNDWGSDFGVYIQQARNFAEHRPFFETTYVATPESLEHQPAIYPPLPSLLLAPVYATRGLDYRAMKLLLAFFFWFSLPFYYMIGCRRGIQPHVMAVIILLFVLTPLVLRVGQNVASDFVFMFVSALTLLGIDEIYRRKWDVVRPLFGGLLAAVLLFLCYFTRVTGLALIGGFAVYEVLRSRRFRTFNMTAAALITSGFLLYTRFLFDARGQYGSQFVLQPAIWIQNGIAYLHTPAEVWGAAPAMVRYLLSGVTLVLAVTGLIRRLRRPEPAELYICIWQAGLLFYSVYNRRYMLMAVPFLLMYAAETIEFLRRKLALSRPAWSGSIRAALAVCVMGVMAVSLANLRVADTRPVLVGASQPSFAELCAFLRLNTPDDGLILSWNPRVIALYTQKPSGLYPQSGVPQDFEAAVPIRTHRLLVVYRQDPDPQLLTPYLAYAAPRLARRFENADFQVFAIPDNPEKP